MKFGLMFFTNDERPGARGNYDLVLESAHFADAHDFSALWLPERHFSQLGCLYPNPAVLHAAVAAQTRKIRLRAGSVVPALHNPLRIAEEWAMVDNLSGGRVEVSFASGWHPRDFAFFPERYADRREAMFRGIEMVQKLWAGGTQSVEDGNGERIEVRTYPTPIQAALPTWITAAGSPDTCVRAGTMGADLLTHMFTQDLEELEQKVSLYRQARADAGHDPDAGRVAVMLHTFVGTDLDTVREQVRDPYCAYLKSNGQTFLKGLAQNKGAEIDLDRLSATEFDDFIGFVFDRFFGSRALMGTPESCQKLVHDLAGIGVNEIACLLDFGPDEQLILENLRHLNVLRVCCQDAAPATSRCVVTTPEPGALPAIRARCKTAIDVDAFYANIAQAGADWGAGFKAITHLWQGDGEALGRVEIPDPHKEGAKSFGMHPTLWDNCFELLGALILDDVVARSNSFVLLQQGYDRVRVFRPAGSQVWSHFVLRQGKRRDGVFEGDARILGPAGELVAEVTGFRAKLLVLEENTCEPAGEDSGPQQGHGWQEYQALDAHERAAFVTTRIVGHVEAVLGVAGDQINPQHSLIHMGLDSILAISLRNQIELDLGVTIPLVSFLQDMTTEQLQNQAAALLEEEEEFVL